MSARVLFSALFVAVLAYCTQKAFMHRLAQSFSFPQDDLFGRLAQQAMSKMNAPGMYDALARLGLKDGETLLEICSGPGLGVEEALRYEGVTVLSVDLSEDMVRRASERNAAAVSQGRARLYAADVADLSLVPSASIDKVFHMNCIYFWRDLDAGLSELLRVLKPGAPMLAAVKFRDIAKLGSASQPFFLHTNETRVLEAMRRAGFVEVHSKDVRLGTSCTGVNYRSGCLVDERMHYTAVHAAKPRP